MLFTFRRSFIVCQEAPPTEEEIEARDYVQKRELPRPETSVKKALGWCGGFVLCTILITYLTYISLDFMDDLSLSQELSNFTGKHTVQGVFGLYGIVFMIGFLLCLKSAMIGVIRLYQHYAPENVRRKCLFKPTCSEYMILAIKKYGVIRGSIKGTVRLVCKCKGIVYRIDYP